MLDTPAIHQFRLNADKQKHLAAALKLDIVAEVLELLEEAARPKPATGLAAPAGLHHDSVVSREYHRLLGIQQTVETIRGMVTPKKVAEKPEPPAELWVGDPDDLVS